MLDSMHAAEIETIIELQKFTVPELVMRGLSNLGPSAYLLGFLGFIYLCGNSHLGARLLLAYFGSQILSYWSKLALHSPRPFWMDERVQAFEPHVTSYGLPSGHSLVATCVWLMLASVVRKGWFWALAIVVILLISLSRVWLGSHFISDVALGWVFGAAFIFGFWRVEAKFEQSFCALDFWKQILLPVLVAAAVVVVGLLLHTSAQASVDPRTWPRYPAVARSNRSMGSYAGAILGLGIGLVMASRWARFEAGGAIKKRILRVLMVAAPATLYWARPRNLLKELPDLLAFSLLFVGCAVAAWGFSFFVPWLFLRIGLCESRAPSARTDTAAISTCHPKSP
jgi:membrane-associated phospholipid phosphatase